MRTAGLPLAAGWAFVCLLGTACFPAGRSGTPDVILITLDTTRSDHLGAYGYDRGTTPSLDRFAEDAVVFRRAWSTSSWTLPAHASMFTGKHPTSHGAHRNLESAEASLGEVITGRLNDRAEQVRTNRLGEEAVTLAELLRDKGYATAAFAGGPWLSPVFGLLQGYDFIHAEASSFAGREAGGLTNAAIAWLHRVGRDRPVHLLVNYFDPHHPYRPPPIDGELPRTREPLGLYDAEIRYMDHHLGRLLAALRDTGRYHSALIVIVADHGESFGEHGLSGHGYLVYEELLRVPLLIRFPGGRGSGTEEDAPVSIVDLLPLAAEEADLPVPDGVEGVPVGTRDIVLAENFRDAYAIGSLGERFDRDLFVAIQWPWKLIQSDRGEVELYRLADDPGELANRSGMPEEAGLRRALAKARGQLEPPTAATHPQDVDPSTVEKLRALGYIE